MLVGGARFFNSAEVLDKKGVEKAPTTMTAFVGKIAIETVLHGQVLLNALPNLDTRLKHAVCRHQEAGSAVALIDHSASEIISVKVFPVPSRLQVLDGQLINWNVKEPAS